MPDVPAHLLQTEAPIVASDSDLRNAQSLGLELVAVIEEIEKLEEVLKAKKERRNQLMHREIPEFFGQIDLDRVGIPSKNVDLIIKPFYAANIAASWEEDRRQRGFRYLEELGHGDVIKTTVSVILPRGSLEEARRLESQLHTMTNHAVVFTESVSHQTLTALVKEQIEDGCVLDLDKLGATVGRVADFKKRKK